MSDYKCRKGVEYSSHYNLRKSVVAIRSFIGGAR